MKEVIVYFRWHKRLYLAAYQEQKRRATVKIVSLFSC